MALSRAELAVLRYIGGGKRGLAPANYAEIVGQLQDKGLVNNDEVLTRTGMAAAGYRH